METVEGRASVIQGEAGKLQIQMGRAWLVTTDSQWSTSQGFHAQKLQQQIYAAEYMARL